MSQFPGPSGGYYPLNVDLVGAVPGSPFELDVKQLRGFFFTKETKAAIARLLQLWQEADGWCGISSDLWLAGQSATDYEALAHGLNRLANSHRVYRYRLTDEEYIIYPTFEFVRMFKEVIGWRPEKDL